MPWFLITPRFPALYSQPGFTAVTSAKHCRNLEHLQSSTFKLWIWKKKTKNQTKTNQLCHLLVNETRGLLARFSIRKWFSEQDWFQWQDTVIGANRSTFSHCIGYQPENICGFGCSGQFKGQKSQFQDSENSRGFLQTSVDFAKNTNTQKKRQKTYLYIFMDVCIQERTALCPDLLS